MTQWAIKLKIKGFPKPVYDEVLTSWLFRCLYNTKNASYEAAHLGLIIKEMCETGRQGGDPDFDFESNNFFALQKCLGIDKKTLEFYFRPKQAWLLPWENRSQFCYNCLIDDITSHKLPAWRKSWCYANILRCEIHNRELDFMPLPPTETKPWDYFGEHFYKLRLSPEPSKRAERMWESPKAAKLRGVLYKRIHRVSGLKTQPPEDFGDLGKNSYCFIMLMHILLKARSPAISAGIARKLYSPGRIQINHRIKSPQESIQAGVFECSTKERISALILAGYLASMLPRKNLELINRVFSEAEFPLPKNIHSIVGGSTSKKESEPIISIISQFNNEFLGWISEFHAAIKL